MVWVVWVWGVHVGVGVGGVWEGVGEAAGSRPLGHHRSLYSAGPVTLRC